MIPELPNPLVMHIHFNPFGTEELCRIFTDDTARNLYLAWRWCHLAGPYFNTVCLSVAKKIDTVRPQSAVELAIIPTPSSDEISQPDWERFAPQLWRVLSGEVVVQYTSPNPPGRIDDESYWRNRMLDEFVASRKSLEEFIAEQQRIIG